MKRYLGLDVGTKTIGVAVSDGLGLTGHPVCTIRRKGVRSDCERIRTLVAERNADAVVVGLPLELDGSEARSARLARQIGEALSDGLEVHYVDERYSSVEAEQKMLASGASRSKRKAQIDQAAAVIILERFLQAAGS